LLRDDTTDLKISGPVDQSCTQYLGKADQEGLRGGSPAIPPL